MNNTPDAIYKRRRAYLKKHIDGRVVATYNGNDCSEYIINRWGDAVTIRIYGDSSKNFRMVER